MADRVTHDVRIPTADPDVTLSGDLYLPVAASAATPVPALVTVLPYRKDLTDALGTSLRWFAAHGYACLLVDLRGIGSSDGDPRPRFDPGEADDAVAAIAWAAAQPWCTGHVGMWGMSYGAAVTLRTATRRPPALRAIIPVMGALDAERDLMHPGGARGDLVRLAQWGGGMLMQQLVPPLTAGRGAADTARWHRRLHEIEPYLLDLARLGPGDPAWRDRVVDPAEVAVPALCVGGWDDLFADAVPRAYERLRGPRRLLMGPWAHTLPHEAPVGAVDFLSIALRWWDRWLRAGDAGPDEPPVVLHVTGAGWLTLDAWPPPTEHVELAWSEPGEYRPDPTAGVLSGPLGIGLGGHPRPLDQHDDDVRALHRTTEPFATDTVVCGRPEVAVLLADGGTDAPDVERLVVRLAAVAPDGRSTHLTSGVLVPGGPAARLGLGATAFRIPAGHRLRVVVGDADFPRLVPTLRTAPIRVARVELSLPVLPPGTGRPVDLPGLPGAAGIAGRFTVGRNPARDEVRVAIGGSTPEGRTAHGHRLRIDSGTVAVVRRAAPAAAALTATHAAHATLTTGERVAVQVTVRCTRTDLHARGTVTTDGVTVLDRSWTVPLEKP